MKKELRRNDSCHCGSGAKYKNCHAKSESNKPVPLLFGVVVLIVAFLFFTDNPASGSKNQNISKPFIPQKTGKNKLERNAPPGKVWSSEHGHWHDSNNPHHSFAIDSKLNGNALQNQVEAPPGKVWSPEHGHWHDKK